MKLPMNAGEFANLQCIVPTGDLPLNIRWSYPGEEMGGSSGVLAKKVADRVSMLMISVITARHAGEYVCTAENAAGTSSHSTVLTVNGSVTTTNLLFLENTAFTFRSSIAFSFLFFFFFFICHLSRHVPAHSDTQTSTTTALLPQRFSHLLCVSVVASSAIRRSSKTRRRRLKRWTYDGRAYRCLLRSTGRDPPWNVSHVERTKHDPFTWRFGF